MTKLAVAVCFAAAMLQTGCTYKADVLSSPSFSAVTNYDNKVPGLWMLYIDSAPLRRPIKPSGMACAAHKFDIDAADPFTTSVNQTLSNVVEEIELVQSPLTNEQLRSRGARGIIVVRGEELRAKLDVKPGFWTAAMEGQATVIASVTVNSPKGRLLGTTVEGIGNADAEAGSFCAGGGKSLGEAVSQGMKDTMRKIAEAISNSERVRAN